MTVRRCLLVVAGIGAAVLAGAQSTAAVAMPQGTAADNWSVNTNPSAPTSGVTISVSCPTSSFCAAVGFYQSGDSNTLKGEAWLRLADGKWHTSTVVDNVGLVLNSVSCVSSTFCIATTDQAQSSSDAKYAYKFDGKSWTRTSAVTTEPGDTVRSVSCVSTTWCLAAGTRGATAGKSPGGTMRSFLRPNVAPRTAAAPALQNTARIWRFNGKQWDVGSAPVISGSADVALNNVACRSTSFCLTAGLWAYNGKTHPWVGSFNGTKWTTSGPAVPTGYDQAVLNGISCPSTSECTAVGIASVTPTEQPTKVAPLAATLAGGVWTLATLPPAADGNQQRLEGVSCAANGSCTAVGGPSEPTPGGRAYAVTRSGSTWTLDTTPSITDATALAISVSCTSATTCQAGGLRFISSVNHEYLMSK